jgi:hypothetical protein
MNKNIWAVALLALACVGCSSIQNQAAADFNPPRGSYKMVVMRPDISVSVLTAGGTVEPREDWTNTAREQVLAALQKQQLARGGSTRVALTREDAGGSPEQVLELERLHEVVGQSIRIHKYSPYGALPTKKDKFDWTLGELAVQYGGSSGYDYALFLFARDSFSSSGRQALQALGFLGCVVGVCMMPGGGIQAGFVSLVDLRTGHVVWFNHLVSGVGDIRTPEGASKIVNQLLAGMNEDSKARKKKKA